MALAGQGQLAPCVASIAGRFTAVKFLGAMSSNPEFDPNAGENRLWVEALTP